jgi:hypothetical protein
LLDLIDEDCATALGAGSVTQAKDKLKDIKITFNDLGTMNFVTAGGRIVADEKSPRPAQLNTRLGSRGINLNTQVNWADPNNTSALLDGNPYTYPALDAQAALVAAPSMTAAQYMDYMIAHELAHSFINSDAKVDDPKFGVNLWEKCFK